MNHSTEAALLAIALQAVGNIQVEDGELAKELVALYMHIDSVLNNVLKGDER